MSATSNWIPRERIRVAVVVASAITVIAVVGTAWSRLALLLLVPALGAGWVAFVMLRTRHQLSPDGGDWERRIHDLVVSRLPLAADSQASVLDIGCGDASLLVALLDVAPAVSATGIDLWGPNWDYAPSACEARLASVGRRATFRRMDAARLDFADASFDIVVSVMCFHEARSPAGTPMRGPLAALDEALRVLRPGGAFVLVDRFGDASEFGDPTGVTALLASASELGRESLVATQPVPWPLRSAHALGPVEVLSGRKAVTSRPRHGSCPEGERRVEGP